MDRSFLIGGNRRVKNEFLIAITQLAAEKNLPKEVVFEAVETALASAYKKDNLAQSNVVVKIDPNSGATHVFSRLTVVEEVTDPRQEVTPDEAKKLKVGAKLGDFIDTEVSAQTSGRIAAQTAKQVVLQRLREAEREVVFEEYAGREGDIVSGEVLRMEGRNVIVDLGKAEAVLPPSEQVRIEHYRPGQRHKFYVLEVYKAAKGPQVVVSRTHKYLIRRLFELEVPEIFKGAVEIKAIAREAGFRSKVAVWSNQEGVDPVGACVGLRGLRIQNVVNELNGERIDVVLWDPEPIRFVAHALSPAQVTDVRMDPATNTAEVVVPDRQLSLAIGKEGQNARLAAKLSGWRIDIRSQSAHEEYLATHPQPEAPEAPAAVEPVEAAVPAAEPEVPAVLPPEQEAVLAYQEGAPAVEGEVAVPVGEAPAEAVAEEESAKPVIRFAEEVLPAAREGAGKKVKAKKALDEEEMAKAKKPKRAKRVVMEEEDDEFDYAIH
jgi:N utilization substance protein A